MRQPLEMFALGNNIIKAVFQERKKIEKKYPEIYTLVHMIDPHCVVAVGLSHLRQSQEK